jgi:hypothetical protein
MEEIPSEVGGSGGRIAIESKISRGRAGDKRVFFPNPLIFTPPSIISRPLASDTAISGSWGICVVVGGG